MQTPTGYAISQNGQFVPADWLASNGRRALLNELRGPKARRPVSKPV